MEPCPPTAASFRLLVHEMDDLLASASMNLYYFTVSCQACSGNVNMYLVCALPSFCKAHRSPLSKESGNNDRFSKLLGNLPHDN